jgi:integrase/recombinase XerD
MATAKIVYRETKIKSNGEVPLYLRVIKNRKAGFVSLGYSVLPKHWDTKNNKVKPNHPNSAYLNAFLTSKLSEAEGVSLECELTSKHVTTRSLKYKLLGVEPPSFIKFVTAALERQKLTEKEGTYRKNHAIIGKLKKYLEDKDLLFASMDVAWLKKYEVYLAQDRKNSINTIHTNLKVIRKYFNEAVDESLIPYESSPFLRYKLKSAPVSKEYLTEKELRAFDKVKFSPDSICNLHRDMFVFAAYSAGLRISDILLLRWLNFDGTHLNVTTHKTGAEVSIFLPTRALEILRKYKPKKDDPEAFIFPCLDKKIDYSDKRTLFLAIATFNTKINNSIHDIASLSKVNKDFSFHSSRHCFAVNALKKGMRIEYVSKLMTHSSIRTTQIYAKIVNNDLDVAMKLMNTPVTKPKPVVKKTAAISA